jgi:hypothetical protein
VRVSLTSSRGLSPLQRRCSGPIVKGSGAQQNGRTVRTTELR